MVQNYYNSESNHSFSCTATFDDNADISLEIQLCKDNSFKPITEDSAFALSASSDQEITGKCTRQKSVVYNFNFTQVSNGTLLRCLATDHNLNISATTECLPLVLKPPGKGQLLISTCMSLFDFILHGYQNRTQNCKSLRCIDYRVRLILLTNVCIIIIIIMIIILYQSIINPR